MLRQVTFLSVLLPVCILAACERVPEGPQAGKEAEDLGTVLTLSITNVPTPASTQPADGVDEKAPQQRVAVSKTPTSGAPVPEALFTLTSQALSEEACAAAGVARYGTGQHVYCVFSPTSSPLRLSIENLPRGTAPRTLVALVQIIEPMVDATIVALGSWQPSNLFALALSPYRTYFLWGYAQDIHSVSPITTGTWVHLAATYDGKIATLYVNGVGERQLPLALDTSAHGLQLGGRRFHGVITDVRVWDSVLHAEQIARVAQEALERVASDAAKSTVPVSPASDAEGAAATSDVAEKVSNPDE